MKTKHFRKYHSTKWLYNWPGPSEFKMNRCLFHPQGTISTEDVTFVIFLTPQKNNWNLFLSNGLIKVKLVKVGYLTKKSIRKTKSYSKTCIVITDVIWNLVLLASKSISYLLTPCHFFLKILANIWLENIVCNKLSPNVSICTVPFTFNYWSKE